MILSATSVLVFSVALGQLQKFYSLSNEADFDTVSFSLHAASGNCFVKSSPDLKESPLVIYGNPDLEKINPSFKFQIKKNTCYADLDLQEFRSSSLGDGLVFAMLRSSEEEHNYWKIHFDDKKIYKLDLNYGVGNADIDLSNSSIKSFKLKSGTADINVDYSPDSPNRIEMDTFKVQVDMGTFTSNHLELANARQIIAHVGFGSALLDLEKPNKKSCSVKASVGAGNLDIIIPNKSVPIIIHLKESPLCGVKLAPGFEQVESNVYVNMAYSNNAENLLAFNIDVALGNVSFKYKD
ncbi:MAG: hypothetical protein ACFHWX_00265 [Bacteroidota bacterium]